MHSIVQYLLLDPQTESKAATKPPAQMHNWVIEIIRCLINRIANAHIHF